MQTFLQEITEGSKLTCAGQADGRILLHFSPLFISFLGIPTIPAAPAVSSHRGNLLVLGRLLNSSLLADDLLQPLQPNVLRAQVPHARLAAMEQRQGVDVLQLRVADALVHHQVEQLVRRVVQHLVVLPDKKRNGDK